jgi:hypothetical protein
VAQTVPLFAYTAADFQAKPDPKYQNGCDLVMKGGITSGVVYPYAILELAKAYRFRSIGGASAGGIAAAFAGAAEYSRTVRGDPDGFLRMQAYCETLPTILASLFQPYPRFTGLMQFLLKAQAGGPLAWLAPLAAFWGSTLAGAVIGGGVMGLLHAGVAGVVLGMLTGVVAAVLGRVIRLVLVDLPKPEHGFGLCSGLTQPGQKVPALTDWLHRALQDIAFADPDRADPLTFGDLAGPDPDQPVINLRMMTTNLSMGRPHNLPVLGMLARYRTGDWVRLFPATVMTYLGRISRPSKSMPDAQVFPRPAEVPVIVAVRMSLSFPVLFSAVPVVVRDIETASLLKANGVTKPVEVNTVWFSDGGISSNFPIHMFDALLPTRPTFALSLDALPAGGDENGRRVIIPQTAGEGVGLPVHPIAGLGAFAGAILGAAKDWQDALLGGMPGQRERIARVMLSAKEGGLNLTMPAERSRALMRYGQEVGRRFANGALDFDEHRWRRALVSYEQVAHAVAVHDRAWNAAGYGPWFASYAPHAKSYKKLTQADRKAIHARLGAMAKQVTTFTPPILAPDSKFPRPSGRLRIVPDV